MRTGSTAAEAALAVRGRRQTGRAADGEEIADALQHAGPETIIAPAPETARPALAHDLAAAVASSMNGLLLTGGLVAMADGVLFLLLIRPATSSSGPRSPCDVGARC